MPWDVPREKLFKKLWTHYKKQVPDVETVEAILKKKKETFVNDHIAFRTFRMPHVGLSSLEKVFLNFDYYKVKDDRIEIPDKKIIAYWYKPANLRNHPKIFISELQVDALSSQSRAVIEKYTSQVTSDLADKVNPYKPHAVFKHLTLRPWLAPTYLDYKALAEESEVAAWILAHGNHLNHFTVAVHYFQHIQGIHELNELLEAEGIELNDAGGKIQGSKEQLLMQSSTRASKIPYHFADGEHEIPYAYIEFAQRFVRPECAHFSNPHPELYFQGFKPQSASKIFESTFEKKKK